MRTIWIVQNDIHVLSWHTIVKKIITIWNENVNERLQRCFVCTDWSVFLNSCHDIINWLRCEWLNTFLRRKLSDKKTITCLAKNKPWVTKELKRYILQWTETCLYGKDWRKRNKCANGISNNIKECKASYKKKKMNLRKL